jgi:hypothetical protein
MQMLVTGSKTAARWWNTLMEDWKSLHGFQENPSRWLTNMLLLWYHKTRFGVVSELVEGAALEML